MNTREYDFEIWPERPYMNQIIGFIRNCQNEVDLLNENSELHATDGREGGAACYYKLKIVVDEEWV